jgi:hypothetical protein
MKFEQDLIKTNIKSQNLDQVLNNLEKCSCLFIDCYQQILEERKLLDSTLDDAYLNLSKARSIIGCSNLSILQVPNENLTANVKIEINEPDQKNDLDLIDKFNNLSIDLIRGSSSTNNKPSNWFGVLTPLSLKQSQTSFNRSLNLIKSICELQIKIQNLQFIYSDLLKRKDELVAVSN